ncbi:hypothetical protein J5J10_13900 [Ciceribacter sp. L1K23]|uniref:hypothetical protein n=1 Tax=unclassified Ciceribacter TaxID=2628820 RepID=UPI001ABDFB71|nr:MULTISPECIES: hypothetical protein [unclassified Ciceribacter]MBO3759077.1 hypothetical protein [Ciceribacter sp. L1K22]MBR0556776.1 hypothetical protein [Ciceribacter sp. L1K23]
MPQLVFLLLLVGGALLLYRRFVADAQKLQKRSQEMQKEQENGAIGTLVKDEKTGEYRVKRDDE